MIAPESLRASLGGVLAALGVEGESRLESLPGSTSGRVFRLSAGSRRWMLRHDDSPAGAARLAREYQVLQSLQGTAIAPVPACLDAAAGLLACEYVDGTAWSELMVSRPAQLKALAGLLAVVHAQPVVGEPMAPLEVLRGYLAGADRWLAGRLLDYCGAALDHMDRVHRALCHHDVWRGNLVQCPGQAGATRLIDWEYAGCGDPLFDLATVVCYHDLDAEQADVLWRAYEASSGQARDRQDLARWCVVVDALTVGWAMAGDRHPAHASGARFFAGPAARRLGL